jgi:hypothetical protein
MSDSSTRARRALWLAWSLALLTGCDGPGDGADPASPGDTGAARYLLLAVAGPPGANGQPSFALGTLRLDPATRTPAAQPQHSAPAGEGYPLAIASHPTQPRIYLGQQTSGVAAFSIDKGTGRLAPIAGSSFRAPDYGSFRAPSPAALAFDATGSRLFVAHDDSSNQPSAIEVFGVDPDTGALQAPSRPLARAGSRACSLALHPSERVLYVGSCFDHALHVFDVSAAGGLTPASGSPLVMDFLPSVVSLDASGRWLLTVDAMREELVAIPLNPAQGRPEVARAVRTRVPQIYPIDLAVDRRSGSVLAYLEEPPRFRLARLRLDPDTGQGTIDSVVPIEDWPGPMALERTGEAVHILDQTGDRITTIGLPAPPLPIAPAPGSPVTASFVGGVRPALW